MSEYNVPNYKEQGGAKWVVDGELEITGTLDLTGATVEGVVNNLTTTASGKALDARQGKALKDTIDDIAGDVAEIDGRVAANIPDSTEETNPTTAQFNALLAALKAAGLMVADED